MTRKKRIAKGVTAYTETQKPSTSLQPSLNRRFFQNAIVHYMPVDVFEKLS